MKRINLSQKSGGMNCISDTHPSIERVHIKLLRKASVSKRLQITASLIKTAFNLSWNGFCECYSDLPETERIERFIFYLYGDKSLARKFAAALFSRNKKGTK